MDADYNWLFPKGRFSYQAKMLETQLLYSGSLEKSQETERTKQIPEHGPNRSLIALAKRELFRLSAAEVVTSPSEPSCSRSEDRRLRRLQQDVMKKEREASRASQNLQRETLQRLKLKGENGELARQLEKTLEQIGQLESRLSLQDRELASRINTATKQAKAQGALKGYMEDLMQRAETAEYKVDTLKRSIHATSPTPRSLHSPSSPGYNERITGHGHSKWQYDPSKGSYNRLQTPYSNTLPSSHTHNQSWQSPRHRNPDEIQTSPSGIHTGNQYPDHRVSPTLSQTDLAGHHQRTSFHGDSGLESYSTGNRVSDDHSGGLLITKSPTRPTSSFLYDEGISPSYIPNEQLNRHHDLPSDKFQSGTSLSHSLTNTPGIFRSRDNVSIEPVIQPSVNSSLQQMAPDQQRSSGKLGPLSNRPWDLNFLNEVMDDVLKNREAQNRPHANKLSNGTLQMNQSNIGSLPANQLHSPVQVYRPTPDADWSSSDYDDDDYDDDDDDDDDSNEETESASDDAQSKMTRSKHPGRSNASSLSVQHPRLKTVWLCVFNHLNTETLLTCAQVCREWRTLTKNPSLWQTVRLSNHKISSKTISKWCEPLAHLYLEGLKPRSKLPGESMQKYTKNTRGSLEPGLEYILLTAGTRLITLKIVDCSNLLTERSLFLASCYCRNLYSLTFISQTDPVGHEVIWALGAGCRNIASLKIPPRQPCQQHQRLSNHCLQMIGRCWPLLLALSIGGPSIDVHGLVSVAHNCPRLQVLELDHLPEVTDVIAIAMCQAGLRGLHTLILRNTSICPAAIMQFNGACPQLRSLSVYLNPSICRGDNRDFHNVIAQLRTLTKKRVLSDVLHVYAKYN